MTRPDRLDHVDDGVAGVQEQHRVECGDVHAFGEASGVGEDPADVPVFGCQLLSQSSLRVPVQHVERAVDVRGLHAQRIRVVASSWPAGPLTSANMPAIFFEILDVARRTPPHGASGARRPAVGPGRSPRLASPFQQPTILATSSRFSSLFPSVRCRWKVWVDRIPRRRLAPGPCSRPSRSLLDGLAESEAVETPARRVASSSIEASTTVVLAGLGLCLPRRRCEAWRSCRGASAL